MLPFDPDAIQIEASKHFRNTTMRRWNWDVHDIRDALREPVRVVKKGKVKLEVWVHKNGSKKLVLAPYLEEGLVLVITGTEG